MKETGSEGLSLQSQAQAIICPKCQHKRTANDPGPNWQCPSCGIAYNKALAPSAPLANKVNNAPRARGDREINRDELETVTPPVISLSMTGRMGRLRYLAFSWPIYVLCSFLGMLAAVIVPLNFALGMLLLILGGVLCLWMSLRLMALRMHDVNLSSKWILALLLLPGVAGAVGAPQMVLICADIFWIAALLLAALPGSEIDNNYGPPPGANTTMVKVGAGLVIAFMALGVVANIKYMQYVRSAKLHSALSTAPSTIAEQPGSRNVQNGAMRQRQIRGRANSGWAGTYYKR